MYISKKGTYEEQRSEDILRDSIIDRRTDVSRRELFEEVIQDTRDILGCYDKAHHSKVFYSFMDSCDMVGYNACLKGRILVVLREEGYLL